LIIKEFKKVIKSVKI